MSLRCPILLACFVLVIELIKFVTTFCLCPLDRMHRLHCDWSIVLHNVSPSHTSRLFRCLPFVEQIGTNLNSTLSTDRPTMKTVDAWACWLSVARLPFQPYRSISAWPRPGDHFVESLWIVFFVTSRRSTLSTIESLSCWSLVANRCDHVKESKVAVMIAIVTVRKL